MPVILSPRARRNISRIIPFGLIWLLSGWVFLFIDVSATGFRNLSPETNVTVTPGVLAFASLAVLLIGLLVGAVELIWLENLFRRKALWQKVLSKFLLYTTLMLLILAAVYPLAAMIELDASFSDPRVWEKWARFFWSTAFLSTVVQIAVSLFLSLLYAVISEHIGHSTLLHLITGRYHSPREEQRIFLFLDMKSSTTLAEKLGHVRYFHLLRDYYADLSAAIVRHGGEVYQYIGDEVVITWPLARGVAGARCLLCFFAMRADLYKRRAYYEKYYGFLPDFKAGMHAGEVTTGEIGALKKEIFFTGDVLNTAARIQGLCNEYGATFLVSGDLMEQVLLPERLSAKALGAVSLRGRAKEVQVFAVEKG